MDRGEKIALLGLVGVGAFLAYKLRQSIAISTATGHAVLAGDHTFAESDLTKTYDHTFDPLMKLPGVGQAIAAITPVYNGLVKPLKDKLNATISPAINKALGSGTKEITFHEDGTIDRHIKDPNWYERNVGEPISSGATNVGKAVYHAVKFW